MNNKQLAWYNSCKLTSVLLERRVSLCYTFLCARMHVWALAEVCVVVAGSIEREAESFRLWAVCCGCCARPQTADKYQATPPSSGPTRSPPLSNPSRFHFLCFHTLISPPLLFSVFSFPSTRGSPWQCARAGDRKWVSGSAQATGSGWLRSGCNLTPLTPRAAQHTPARFANYRVPVWDHFNLTFLSLESLNFCFDWRGCS